MEKNEIDRAWELLKRITEETKPAWMDSILEHASIVHDASLYLAERCQAKRPVKLSVLRLGAILHDVGRSRAKRIVEHGVKSGEIIREQGFPEAVARIGETHIGVGITQKEARSLGLPQGDYIPRTLEERIVCYVDNLLYYIPKDGRHELRDKEAVVQRFTKELGEEYGKRACAFMEQMESEMGPEIYQQFREYVEKVNRMLRQDSE